LSTVVVKRLPRKPGPEYPSGQLILDSPPELPQQQGRGWTSMLMVLPMLSGSAAMALMYSRFGGGGTLGLVTGGLFGLSAIGMLATVFGQQAGGPGKREMIRHRRSYMRHLSQQRANVRRTIRAQRRAAFYRHPDPDGLWSIPPSARMWERRRGDVDFGQLRVALGPQELATPILPPASKPLEDLEPMCALALRRFVTTYAVLPDMPIVMALNGFSSVYLRGDPERARALWRAALAQLACFHAPDDVLVAVCASAERRAAWEWVKWLPHAMHPTKTDALGQLRLVAPSVAALEAMLDDVLANRPRFNLTKAHSQSAGPHVVVVLDGGDTAGSDHLKTDGGVDGVTLVDLDSKPPRVLDAAKVILDVARDGTLRSTTSDGETEVGRADGLSITQAEALALQLAPLRLSGLAEADEQPLTANLELADLLGLGDPYTFDPVPGWRARPNRDRLRVAIGVGPDGAPVELDLKESAQDGMGPHGLLIGATGSGKSELLRTLVLALAATHDPATLNFVLVDFKGGATFATLDRLPHTSAIITNLADQLPLVDRMTEAISGEVMRREELLRSAGNFRSQRDYERARVAGAPLEPLPTLLVVCDEFSELLTAKPDFIDMFVQIGRVGRSLGIHLLLASQRLEEGRLRGLDHHLSYRIGLRTFSAVESRAVLSVPDAYHLPRSPGHGYLKFGTEPMIRFKAAYVSGVHRRPDAPAPRAAAGHPCYEYTTVYQPVAVTEQPKAEPVVVDDVHGETLLDILVQRIGGRGRPAHQVWLPPLSEPPTLDQILPALVAEPGRGVTVGSVEARSKLVAPIGVVDRPFDQRRDLLWLDVSGAAGHAVVVGAPQSGKSTLLRTLVLSFALTHSPREVQFYLLDFGGGGLAPMRDLPHVGGIAARQDPGPVRRTIAELGLLLRLREERFSREGIDSMATYRRFKREGRFADDPFGDVFLVVDGWSTIRSEFEDLEGSVAEIANRGLSFGIHIVAAATRWMDLRTNIRDVFGTRLELRLGDPGDSLAGRRAAMNVPEHRPGRGITTEPAQFLAALPRLDSRPETEDLADALAGVVTDLRKAWDGPAAPAVRLLPDDVPYQSLSTAQGKGLPIGIAETDLQPVFLDFAASAHCLAFGDAECGKSTFLRALAHSIVDRYRPDQARLILVDYRRSLLGAITTEHLIGYGSSASVTDGIAKEVATVMRARLPGADVTPQQLRDRSWWTGPDLYLLVDDYDLVGSRTSNPLNPLLEFLAQGRDIGLHLVLVRRSGGAARALFDPFIAQLKELDSAGLVMSGSRDEGVLLGSVRASYQPPGRGWLVNRRDGARLIQLANLPPEWSETPGPNGSGAGRPAAAPTMR
jgi:DNA segregation ATPase FtsK/SpoIIIE, S-DNA-T family